MPFKRQISVTRRTTCPACAGDGNDDLIHTAVIQNTAQVGEFADHRYPMDLMFLLGRVIIQVTDRVQAELWVFLHFPNHQRTGISRTDDQNISGFPWHGLFTGSAPFCQQPDGKAQAANANQGKQPVNREDRAWKIQYPGCLPG